MKKIFYILLVLFCTQVYAQSEYRFTGEYMGNSTTGQRMIKLDIQVLQSGTWKWIHRGIITTGRNLEMATVESDTNYSARKWPAVMGDPELKEMYTYFMDSFLDRIDAGADLTKVNTPDNTTNNTITLDRSNGNITVQVRGIEGDNRAWVSLASMDNQYFVLYNKSIVPFSANLFDLSSAKLKTADYIVKVVTNKGTKFSAKVSIY